MTAASGVELGVDANAGLIYDSNLGRAATAEDRRGDTATIGSIALAAWFPVTDSDNLRVAAGVSGESHLRYTLLSEAEASLGAVWRHKFGVGLSAPSLAVALDGHSIDSRDKLRDGERFTGEVAVGQRFSERLEGSAGYRFERRLQRHDLPLVPDFSGSVFDLLAHNGFVNGSYALDDRWQLDASYNFRRGDVASISQRGPAVFFASTAIAEENALGPELYGYRLKGTTHTLGAGLSYALGASSSANLTYAYEYTHTVADLDYRTHIVGASWVYRY